MRPRCVQDWLRTSTASHCRSAPHAVLAAALNRRRLVLSDSVESSAPRGMVRSAHRAYSVALVVSELCSTCVGTGAIDPAPGMRKGVPRLLPVQAPTPQCRSASNDSAPERATSPVSGDTRASPARRPAAIADEAAAAACAAPLLPAALAMVRRETADCPQKRAAFPASSSAAKGAEDGGGTGGRAAGGRVPGIGAAGSRTLPGMAVRWGGVGGNGTGSGRATKGTGESAATDTAVARKDATARGETAADAAAGDRVAGKVKLDAAAACNTMSRVAPAVTPAAASTTTDATSSHPAGAPTAVAAAGSRGSSPIGAIVRDPPMPQASRPPTRGRSGGGGGSRRTPTTRGVRRKLPLDRGRQQTSTLRQDCRATKFESTIFFECRACLGPGVRDWARNWGCPTHRASFAVRHSINIT